MSRCFPFPPPGYEKKARIDDTNLLTQEIQKEKKLKKDKKDKDKKDKEKKDKKEKNDKDRSKERHKEKDWKEKHKDKDKDKDKTQLLDERRVDKQTAVRNEEKFSLHSVQRNENNDSKYVQELARRIKDEDKISGSEMLQRTLASDQRGAAGLFGKPVHDEEKFSSVSMQRNENNNSKRAQEFARRNKDEDRTSGSEMLQRNSASDQTAAGLFGKPVQNSIGKQSVENDGFRFKNEDRKKINEQRNHIANRGLGKEFGEILHKDKERVEGIPIPMEKAPDKLLERKEKTKSKDSSVKGEKHKNRDQEKNRKSRDKDQNKEKKKGEKTKEITELSKQQAKIRESGQKLKENSKGSLDSQHTNSLAGSKSSSPGSSGQGDLGKRKEFEMNGYMLENGIRPNKFPRAFSASAPTVENGRKLKSSRTPIQFALEEQGPASNSESDTADCKINGSKVAQQSDPSPSLPVTVPLPSKSLVNQNGGETSAKPPHPDTKYLSQILSVPAMEDFPDVDDQEWLFRSNMQLNKSDKSSPGVEEMQYVWSEARWIESADISALPYVIPY